MLYLVFAFLILSFLAIGTIFYLGFRKNRKKRLMVCLETELYRIRLAKGKKKENPDIKAEISQTEQLFSALSSLDKPFALEVAVHHVGEEIHFYLGVHSSVTEAAIKQVQGVWHDAEVNKVDDYNPFNASGFSTAAYLKQKEHFILPLKTYREIEGDTFSPILNSLAKLNEVGEGAAIQILVLPALKSEQKRIVKSIELLKKGMPLSEIMKTGALPRASDFGKAIAPVNKSKEKNEPKTIDEAAIKSLEFKVSKPLFDVNVRLVASARELVQAEEILSGLMTGFSQFQAPQRNALKVIKLKKPEKLLYQYSFREFDGSEVMVLNSEEIASFFHFPISTTEVPRVKWVKAKEAPPPANLSRSGLYLGESVFRGESKPVYLLDDDRRRHLYIVGQTGTGKSTLIYNCALSDIKSGKGLAVVDPHGDLVNSLLGSMPKDRENDVIIFDPGDVERPIGLNMLEHEASRPEQRTFIVNELYGIFDKLYDLKTTGGPMFEQYMKNALLLLMEDMANEPATLVEIPRVFTDAEYRARKLSRIKNPVVMDFWQNEAVKAGGEASLQNMTPYITSKFNNFIANDYVRPIVGQTKSAFNFREIMDSGKILLVNLSKGRIGDQNANLLGMIITGRILMAALSRTDTEEASRRDFYLYIDEFQSFTTDSIASILSEARKYRLNLVIAHQFIAQLTDKIRDAVFGNVGSVVALRVGAKDAETLVKQFEPVFNENDLINIDNLNAYVKLLINGETSKPFNIKIPLAYSVDKERAEKLKILNHEKYGALRSGVEEDIYRRLRN